MDFKYLYMSPQGRIGRKSFWIGVLILFAINIALAVALGTESAISGIISLISIVPAVMVYIKRCHDRGKSGWWCLLLLIPLVGLIWIIIDLGILKGDEGDNEFGPDPVP